MSVHRFRRLGAEQLERREVFSGDVTAAMVDGNLIVTGDAEANYVAVWQDGVTGDWMVEGGMQLVDGNPQTGTETTINGQMGPQSFSGVTANLQINLDSGDDMLDMSNATVLGDASIDLGAGDNQAVFSAGAVSASATAFELTISPNFTRGGLTFSGAFSLTSGDGNDEVFVDAPTAMQGSVSYTAGAGDDQLHLDGAGTWTITGDLTLDFGAGDDRFVDQSAAMSVAGNVTVTQGDTGEGGSDLWLVNATITGDLTVNAAAGRNLVKLDTVSAANVTIALGDDADAVQTLAVTVASLQVDLGAGDDRDSSFSGISASGNLLIETGDGEDVAPLSNITAGDITVTMGTDGDACTAFDVAANTLDFDMGDGDDVIGVYNIDAQNLTIDGGAGNEGGGYIFGIVVGSSNLAGTVTVNTGAGLDNLLVGSVTAGTVLLTGGSGNQGIVVLSSTITSLTIDTGDDGDVVGCYDSVFDDLEVLLGSGQDQLWMGGLTANNTAHFDGQLDEGLLYDMGSNSLSDPLIENLMNAFVEA